MTIQHESLTAESEYFKTSNSVVLSNRIQACQTFPIFNTLFSGVIKTLSDNSFNSGLINLVTEKDILKLRHSIDKGKPLVKSLALFFKVQENTIKYLAGKKPSPYCEKEFLHRLVHFVKVFDAIPTDLRPNNDTDWQWFESFLDTADSPLCINYQAKWVQQISQLGYQQSQIKLIENCQKDHPAELIADFIGSLTFTINRHAWRIIQKDCIADICKLHANKSQRAINYFIESRKAKLLKHVEKVIEAELIKINIFELAHLANAWKEQLNQLQQAIPPSEKLRLIKWKSLIDAPIKINQQWVTPLACAMDLELESEILQNCAAEYISRCLMDCGVQIFSIRDLNNKPLSTLEIGSHGILRKFYLTQHLAFNNSEPSSECRDTADQFIKYLNNTVTNARIKLITNEWLEKSPAQFTSIYRDLELNSSIDYLFLRYRQYFGKQVFIKSIGRDRLSKLIKLATA